MKKYLFGIILTLAIVGCVSDDHFSFDCENKSALSVSSENINLERIVLPKLETSHITVSKILNDKIYLVDMRYCYVYELDSTGAVKSKMLGMGRTKNEYKNNQIDGFCCAEPDEFIFVGSSNDASVYKLDNNKLVLDSTFFFWEKLEETFGLHKESAAYTLLYDKLTLHKYNDKLYMPVGGSHPIFNQFMPNYFKKTRIIRSFSFNNGTREVMGRVSPAVNDADGNNQFFMFDYDIDSNGDFYVTYELDSLIYVFDNNFKIKESFGNKGKNVDLSTHKRLHLANFRNNYTLERDTKSYYDNIKRVGNYTFRTYKNSIDLSYDGLQIYDDQHTMIADIDTPRGFKVIGKIGDYYYSQILSNEATDELFLYRFKLSDG